MIRIFVTLFLAVILSACSTLSPTMKISDFTQKKPHFSLEGYFSGKRLGQGMFFDRFGTARVSFTAQLNGYREGEEFVLDEVLTYDSGEVLNRQYRFKQLSPGKYQVMSTDLAEPGTVEEAGNALRWRYRLRQDVGGGSIWTLTFDDWMFLQPDGETVLNRSYGSKWGLGIGEVFMSVR